MRRRATSNRRRVTFIGGREDGIVTTPVPAPAPDPLLDEYATRHHRLPARDLIAEAMAAADAGAAPRPSPTGACHDCGRAVTGERLYCGPCAAHRMDRRGG